MLLMINNDYRFYQTHNRNQIIKFVIETGIYLINLEGRIDWSVFPGYYQLISPFFVNLQNETPNYSFESIFVRLFSMILLNSNFTNR
jgi:hypothetical protein